MTQRPTNLRSTNRPCWKISVYPCIAKLASNFFGDMVATRAATSMKPVPAVHSANVQVAILDDGVCEKLKSRVRGCGCGWEEVGREASERSAGGETKTWGLDDEDRSTY